MSCKKCPTVIRQTKTLIFSDTTIETYHHKAHPVRRGVVGGLIGYAVTGGIGGTVIGGAIGTGTAGDSYDVTRQVIYQKYEVVYITSDSIRHTQITEYPIYKVGREYCIEN